MKEERDHAIRGEKESIQKIATLHEELSALTEQLRSNANTIQQMKRQHKEAIDSLQAAHKVTQKFSVLGNFIAEADELVTISRFNFQRNTSELQDKYRQELHNLQLEKQKTIGGSSDGTTGQNLADRSGEQYSELEHNSKISGMALLEREEGEVLLLATLPKLSN